MTWQSSDRRVAIIAGKRTPFVKAGTLFSNASALEMTVHTINATLRAATVLPSAVEDVAIGTVVQSPGASNLARAALLESQLEPTTHALTVLDNCISSITAIRTVTEGICLGRTRIGLAGGVESMSQMHEGSGLVEKSTGLSMGEHTELTVKKWSITREAQDRYTLASHKKAAQAAATGRLDVEIEPFLGVETDGQIRADTSLSKLSALPTVFDITPKGSITAGNASPLTDGAVSMLLMEEAEAARRGLEPLAIIRSIEVAGIDPGEGLLMAPAIAVPRLLARMQLTLDDIDIVEIHEAFAGQVLANIKAWETGWKATPLNTVDIDRLNPNGSSLALGHPLGATGARIVLSIAHSLRREKARYGLVSVCAAGGQAAAVLLERP